MELKIIVKRMKRQPIEWEKIYKSHNQQRVYIYIKKLSNSKLKNNNNN